MCSDLCVLTQVNPFGDVVDGGDPLKEEAAEKQDEKTETKTRAGHVTEKPFTSSQSFLLSACSVTTLKRRRKTSEQRDTEASKH